MATRHSARRAGLAPGRQTVSAHGDSLAVGEMVGALLRSALRWALQCAGDFDLTAITRATSTSIPLHARAIATAIAAAACTT